MTWRMPWLKPLTEGVSWPMVQRWCTQQFKRWAWACLGAVLGAVGVCWMAGDVVSAHEQAQQAVDAAQGQLQAPLLPPLERVNPATHVAGAVWSRLSSRRPHGIWTDLQQTLSAQGVQVVSIRVLPDAFAGPLSGQSVALRLNAPYPDWVNVWRELSASGPVLSMERMSVVPMAQSRGVQLDVVMRWWFRPAPDDGAADPAWSVGMAAMPRRAVAEASGADVFALPLSASSAAAPDAAVLPADPSRWPVSQIRLLGTWQQGVRWQAVISAGGPWVSIQKHGVSLRSAQGQKHELTWPGGER
jgi:hypothetical protein